MSKPENWKAAYDGATIALNELAVVQRKRYSYASFGVVDLLS